VLTLVALLGWQHAACAARARARVSGGDVPSSSVIFAGGGLGALALESIDNAEFYHRSVVVPGDSLRLGSTVARARLRGNMTIALVGGSTSAGGGHSSCPMSIECGLACCGEGYPDLIVRWLRESQSIAATLYNRAIGATGPGLAAMCLSSIFDEDQLAAADLVIVEYAINTDSPAPCIRQVDRLLWRLRKHAPTAAILFVHTYSLARFVDGADECLDLLARQYDLPVLSWKRALYPLLASEALTPRQVFEPPIWHHPNAEGHRHLASLVAHFFLKAEARAREVERKPNAFERNSRPTVYEPSPTVPTLRGSSTSAHSKILSSPSPSCAHGGSALLFKMAYGNDMGGSAHRSSHALSLSLRILSPPQPASTRVGSSLEISRSNFALSTIKIPLAPPGRPDQTENWTRQQLPGSWDMPTKVSIANVMPVCLRAKSRGTLKELL